MQTVSLFSDVHLSSHTPLLNLIKQLRSPNRRECLRILGLGVLPCGLSCTLPSKSSALDTGVGRVQIEPTEPTAEHDTASEVKSDTAESDAVDCPDSTMQISLSEYPELLGVGGSAYVSFPDDFVHILIVCIGNQEWIAVWKICTHGNCNVEWAESLALIECPCHNSLFDWDGSVIQGPAVRPLSAYSVCLDDTGEYLFISRR